VLRVTGRYPTGSSIGITILADSLDVGNPHRHVERPTKVIDITRLPLNKVENTPGGGLSIGALARNTEVLFCRRVGHAAPGTDPSDHVTGQAG
jgi:CO/xanthine dehydrogenase FAD-binding subunit